MDEDRTDQTRMRHQCQDQVKMVEMASHGGQVEISTAILFRQELRWAWEWRGLVC